MATKKSAKVPSKKHRKAPGELQVAPQGGEVSDEELLAQTAYDPAVRSFIGVSGFIKGIIGKQAPIESIDALVVQIREVQCGKMGGVEKTLVVQANTLDAVFNELLRRAALNMGEHLSVTETYLRLAFKAQSQCRTTLETLVAIKNPPVVYARQANVTTGPQQINNGTAASSRARETEIGQSKLSGGNDGLLPDTRASQVESRIDPPMEAVGAINRAKDNRG